MSPISLEDIKKKIPIPKIKAKEAIYYGLLALGILFVLLSVSTAPKRVATAQELLEKRDKSKEILEMLKDENLGTFSPNSSDRRFWAGKEEKPNELEPPQPNDIRNFNDLAIIRMGTKQECFFANGLWLPAVEASIRKILQTEWYDQTMFNKPLVDLSATETAAILASCVGLIGEKLDPELVEEIKRSIRKQVIDPYLQDLMLTQHKELRWGEANCPWLDNQNNWTAVCTANILYTMMVLNYNKPELARTIQLSQETIENYFKGFEADGYLSEGIRYWLYGFSHFILLSESLIKMTDGKINMYENPKIKPIIEFPLKTLLGENTTLNLEYYPLFTDNKNPVPGKENSFQWYIISKRAQLPFKVNPPKSFANDDAEFDLLQNPPPNPEGYFPPKIEKPTDITYFKSAGVLISKWDNKSEIVAIKGGSNNEAHNHNDIGSYTLFTKGNHEEIIPVTGDLGDIVYTSDNISGSRYTYDLISSYGHPVPEVDTQLQNNSPKAKATVLLAKTTQEEDQIIYDLTEAYSVTGLDKLTREAIVKKGKDESFIIKDKFEAKRPMSFNSPLIFPDKPWKVDDLTYQTLMENSLFEIKIGSDQEITTEITKLEADTSNRVKPLYPHKLNIRLKNSNQKGEIRYEISKVVKENVAVPMKSIPPPQIEPSKKPEDNGQIRPTNTTSTPKIIQRDNKSSLWDNRDLPKSLENLSIENNQELSTPKLFPVTPTNTLLLNLEQPKSSLWEEK